MLFVIIVANLVRCLLDQLLVNQFSAVHALRTKEKVEIQEAEKEVMTIELLAGAKIALCLMLLVQIAEIIAKFHFNLTAINQFSAVIVLETRKMPEDLVEEELTLMKLMLN